MDPVSYHPSADDTRIAMRRAHKCPTLDLALGCEICQENARFAADVPEGTGSRSYQKIKTAVRENTLPAVGTILDEAKHLTGNGGERNDSYDHPFPNFSKIADAWSIIFGVKVTPRQVALAMILMKVVRDNHKAKRDNLVDIAGYARCIERLEEWNG